MTDYIFHSLITDRELTEKIASEVLADMSNQIFNLDDVKEAIERYQQKISFEYIKVLGTTQIKVDLDDIPDMPFM